MSNYTRKRRKTKLALPERIASQADNIMNMPEGMVNLPDIKTNLLSTHEKLCSVNTAPLQFSIKVEVEEFRDEEEFIEENVFKEEEHNDLHLISNKSQGTGHTDPQDMILPKMIKVTPLLKKTKNTDNYDSIKPGSSLLKNVCDTKSNVPINKVAKLKARTVKKIKSNMSTVMHTKTKVLTNGQQLITTDSTKNISKPENYKKITVNNDIIMIDNIKKEKIYAEAELIAKKSQNNIDKILAIETKNFWGRVYTNNLEESPSEALIQSAISEWQTYIGNCRDMDTPIFYKCYICRKAWWYLDQFRTHMKGHNVIGLSISLEKNFQKCNIVAHSDPLTYIQNIPVESECYRCGKGYDIHKVSSKDKLDDIQKATNVCDVKMFQYFCMYCNNPFLRCKDLRYHEGSCEKRVGLTFNIHCEYCSFTFSKTGEYESHLALSHDVRSDIPITTQYKICTGCGGKYFMFFSHVCPKKIVTKSCKFCCRKFPSEHMITVHLYMNKHASECPVCQVVLPKKCMEVEHMVDKHTENFAMAYRCTACTDNVLFLNGYSVKCHQHITHGRKFDSRRFYFEKIIVPRKFIEFMTPVLPQKQDPAATVTEIGQNHMDIQNTPEVNNANVDMFNTQEIVIKKEVENDIKHETLNVQAEDLLVNMFLVSKYYDEANKGEDPVIQKEPADKVEEANLIKLDHSYGSANVKETTEINLAVPDTVKPCDIEPEVILKLGHQTQKVYACARCGYKNYHRKYQEHVDSNCQITTDNIFQYVCSKCGTVCDSMKDYLLHFPTHNYKHLMCPHCFEMFENMSKLLLHVNREIKRNYINLSTIDSNNLRTPLSKKGQQCRNCMQKVNAADLFAHWETHLQIRDFKHEGESGDEYDDGVGDESDAALNSDLLNTTLAYLQQPLSWHNRGNVKVCPVCEHVFERRNDSKRHVIEHLLLDAHAKKMRSQRMLKCQICHEGFQKPDIYKHHMRIHGGLPVYMCELCHRSFSDASNYSKHKKVHNLQVLVCDICRKKFQAKESLIKHMEIHQTNNPITCDSCHRVFQIESAFKKHMRYFHNKMAEYKCVMCNLKFNYMKEKWDHMRMVHKEKRRRYKADCPICDSSFRKLQDVKSHVKSVHKMDVSIFNMKMLHEAREYGKFGDTNVQEQKQ